MPEMLTPQQTDALLDSAGLLDRPALIVEAYQRIASEYPANEFVEAIRRMIRTVEFPSPAALERILTADFGWEADWVVVNSIVSLGALTRRPDLLARLTPRARSAVSLCRSELRTRPAAEARFAFRDAWMAVKAEAAALPTGPALEATSQTELPRIGRAV